MGMLSFPLAAANRPQPVRKRWPAPVRLALRGLAVLALLFVIVVGAGIAVIITGPTEIGFVRSRIEAIVQRAVGPDYAAHVGKAVIDVDPVLGLVVEVDEVTVSDRNNAIVASAPTTRFALDPLALLTFRIEISTIEIARPEVSLVRSANGDLYLGDKATVRSAPSQRPPLPPIVISDGGGFPDLAAALQTAETAADPAIAAAIRAGFLKLDLVGGNLTVYEAARDAERSFPNTDLEVTVDPGANRLRVALASSGYGGRWTATVERQAGEADGSTVLSAVFSQLTLADIFPTLGDENAGGVATDIPLYGRATVHFAGSGAVEDASLRLDLGAGRITYGEAKESVLLDEATLKLRWDLDNKVVVVDPSPFYFGRTHGVITGSIRPLGDPAERRYAFQFQAPGAILAPSDSNVPPMEAERIGVEGSIDFDSRQVTFDSMVMQVPGASITAAGSLGYAPDGVAALAASFSPMDVSAFKQMWIPMIAPGARRWVLQHISGGRVAEGKFAAAVPTRMLGVRQKPELTDDQLRLDLTLEDVSFSTYGGIPEIRHASGHAVLAGPTFGVDVDGAEAVSPSGGTVTISAGAFAIANVFNRPSEGDIAVQVSGDAVAIGELANSEPFRSLERHSIAPTDLSGRADVSVSLRLPLIRNLTESDVDWRVVLKGADIASKSPVEGRTVSGADIVISVTPDDFTINGTAKIDGVPADVQMSQPLSAGGVAAGPGAQYARFTLDEAARKRLGIGLDDVLGGSVTAVMRNIEDGSRGQHYDLDLKRARVVMPGLGWSKGVGVPARLAFDLKPADGGFSVENIVLTGAGFGATGSAKLDASHGLLSAKIDKFALRPGDSVAFDLTRTKTGYTVSARGSSFDIRGLIAYAREGVGDSLGSSADLAIDAKIDRLIGFNQEVITGARLSLVSVGGFPKKAAFSGSIGGAPIAFDYREDPSIASLSSSVGDAGRLFRFVDLYTRIEGGTISVSGERSGASGPLAGQLVVDDFDIVNEPGLTRLAGQPAAVPVGGTRPVVDPGRIHFDRALARFRKTGLVIAIDDGVVRGMTVGATLNGRVDFGAGRVQINGTYLPSYAANNAVSRIPLIGLVLSGGASEGLFGVTFRVDGDMTNPAVYFNPLSVVAPGILRKIFEFH